MRRILTASLAALLVLGSWTAARAGDDGALAVDDKLAILLGGGFAGFQVPTTDPHGRTPLAPHDAEGKGYLFTFRYGEYLQATRFNTLMGMEIAYSMGWLDEDAIGMDEQRREDLLLGRFYFELEMGVNLGLFGWGSGGTGSGRIVLAGGAGFNNNYGYMYVSPRLALVAVEGLADLEASFTYLPQAHSYSGNTVREWRAEGTLVFELDEEMSLGLTLQLREGRSPDEYRAEDDDLVDDNPDRIRNEDTQRGEYFMKLLLVSLRFR